jgi:hypothetical protein
MVGTPLALRRSADSAARCPYQRNCERVPPSVKATARQAIASTHTARDRSSLPFLVAPVYSGSRWTTAIRDVASASCRWDIGWKPMPHLRLGLEFEWQT